MTQTISRDALYALVWTEPLRTLAASFDISDVALRKTCQRAAIPTPERGYWARLAAGKRVVKAALPARPPGLSPEVSFGDRRHWYRSWSREELLAPIPPLPEFEETLEAVRTRIEAGLGKVTCPSKGGVCHTGIQRLFLQDEERKRKVAASAYPFAWDQPLFGSATEQRRLRILNSVFLSVGKFGGNATIGGREARDVSIAINQQHVGISLELARSSGKAREPRTADRLCFSLLSAVGSSKAKVTWTDNSEARLEGQLTKIVSEVILAAEIQLRERATSLHQWRIERKAQIEEEDRRQQLERLRLEQERLDKLEQARVTSLLEAADDFRRAQEIRAYVERLGTRLVPNDLTRQAQYRDWSLWALAQADRIDPALNGRFAGLEDPPTDSPQ
jgi:hypothetical protein